MATTPSPSPFPSPKPEPSEPADYAYSGTITVRVGGVYFERTSTGCQAKGLWDDIVPGAPIKLFLANRTTTWEGELGPGEVVGTDVCQWTIPVGVTHGSTFKVSIGGKIWGSFDPSMLGPGIVIEEIKVGR